MYQVSSFVCVVNFLLILCFVPGNAAFLWLIKKFIGKPSRKQCPTIWRRKWTKGDLFWQRWSRTSLSNVMSANNYVIGTTLKGKDLFKTYKDVDYKQFIYNNHSIYIWFLAIHLSAQESTESPPSTGIAFEANWYHFFDL